MSERVARAVRAGAGQHGWGPCPWAEPFGTGQPEGARS